MEQLTTGEIKKTALYEKHRALGAKMVEFHGWMMPLQYTGIVSEHKAVREKGGIFDVSHMGRIQIRGKEAEKFTEYLCTNKIGKRASYTVLANEKGGSVDDAILFKTSPENIYLVANASNREKDLEHIRRASQNFEATVLPLYHDEGILAVQGPKAETAVGEIFPAAKELKPFQFYEDEYEGSPTFISRTGYTGEDGFELYVPNSAIGSLWDKLLQNKEIKPAGLGARDTLRLEMGYALYGHELSENIAPTESVSYWTVKFEKEDFIGKEALLELESSPGKRQQYGVILQDRGIAREQFPVFRKGKKIGAVTSGTLSPTLNRSIAIILVSEKLSPGDETEIEIRGRRCRAKITELPFLKRGET